MRQYYCMLKKLNGNGFLKEINLFISMSLLRSFNYVGVYVCVCVQESLWSQSQKANAEVWVSGISHGNKKQCKVLRFPWKRMKNVPVLIIKYIFAFVPLSPYPKWWESNEIVEKW